MKLMHNGSVHNQAAALLLVSALLIVTGCSSITTTTQTLTNTLTTTLTSTIPPITTTFTSTTTTILTQTTTVTVTSPPSTVTITLKPSTVTNTPLPIQGRVVLAEIFVFVQNYDSYSPIGLQALEQLAAEMGTSKLLVLEYHVNGEYANDHTKSMTASYGVIGTPTVFFDGANNKISGIGPSVADTYNVYKNKIGSESMQPSPVAIVATKTMGSDSLVLNVQITNISDQLLSGAQLSGITYVDQGKSQYHFVVDDIFSSIEVSLSPGEMKSYQLTLPKPAQTVKSVVLLKKSDGLVVQAAWVP
jgi:hypothetical protein